VSLSDEARAVLEMATELQNQSSRPARLASITEKLGITSRRRIGHIVDEIKRASVAKFERLDERGKPRKAAKHKFLTSNELQNWAR